MIALLSSIVAGIAAIGLPALLPLLGLGGAGIFAVARLGLGGLRQQWATHRNWLILLAACAVGAALYAWGAEGRLERDRVLAWRERVCAAGGINVRAATYKQGDCIDRVIALSAFQRDALAASNSLQARALADGAAKSGRDLEQMRVAAQAARSAAETMEKVNAQVEGDRVGADWFAALNRTGGLRDPR